MVSSQVPRWVFSELKKVDQIANNKDILFGRINDKDRYISALKKLYGIVSDKFEDEIIIDSSKAPWYLALLTQVAVIDLFVVHLVRNPMGTCFSWKKEMSRDDAGSHMKRMDTLSNSRRWISCNIALRKLCSKKSWPYSMVRYEDFASAPREVVHRLLDSLGLDIDIPFIDASTVRLGTSHSVWGNPKRLREGVTEIRSDEAWKKHLSFRDKCITGALCGPLMFHYGYLGFDNK